MVGSVNGHVGDPIPIDPQKIQSFAAFTIADWCLFDSLLEAQVLREGLRREYNHECRHSSPCYLTLVELKEHWQKQHRERL